MQLKKRLNHNNERPDWSRYRRQDDDDKTKVHVAETAGTGNSFKYNNFACSAVTAPIVGDSIGRQHQ